MAKIYVKYNFTGVSSPYIIATVTEHDTPLAEVDREVLTAPYTGAITFTSLNAVMHQVRFYQSANGSTLGTLLISASIDATIYNEPTVEIITFEVDAGRGAPHFDPIDGATQYTNVALADCTSDTTAAGDKFMVFQEGLGIVDPSQLNDITNGFELVGGASFTAGAKYQVVIYRTVSVQLPEVIARPYFDLLDKSADFTVSSTEYNCFIRAAWAGSVGTITFPAHASFPNYTRLKISAHGGAQKYVKLQFNGAETIKIYNQNKNVFYLEKGAEIELMWKSGTCYVTDYKGNYLNRGRLVNSYDNVSGFPYLYAHESTGVLNKADYPALYEFIQSLPVGVACTALSGAGGWNETQTINGVSVYVNRRRFFIDTVTEQFRVPDWSNSFVRFLKLAGTADTTRINDVPGGYQADGNLKHKHFGIASESVSNNNGLSNTNQAAFQNDRGASGDFKYTIVGSNNAANVGLTSETGNNEVTVANGGQIPLILL